MSTIQHLISLFERDFSVFLLHNLTVIVREDFVSQYTKLILELLKMVLLGYNLYSSIYKYYKPTCTIPSILPKRIHYDR